MRFFILHFYCSTGSQYVGLSHPPSHSTGELSASDSLQTCLIIKSPLSKQNNFRHFPGNKAKYPLQVDNQT